MDASPFRHAGRMHTAARILLACLFCLSYPGTCPAQDAPFHFAFLSDTHVSRPGSGAATGAEDLIRTVDDINRADSIAFVVVTGDVTELGSNEELRAARAILDRLDVPWYVLPGNHDTKWSESGGTAVGAILGMERFAFAYGGYLFVGTGSGPDMRMGPGLVRREDVVWLDSVVTRAAASGQPVIYFNHYPLDSSLANWYEVVDVLKKADTRAVLHGHGHRNRAADYEGIPGVMGRSNLRAGEAVGGYNVVTLAADTLSFAVRVPGSHTESAWHRVPLKDRRAEWRAPSYERPSYAINDRYAAVRRVWERQDDSNVGAGAAAADGIAVYPNTAGRVVALDVRTGRPRWTFRTRNKVYSTPALADGTVVVASNDGGIYALDLHTGALRWDVQTGSPIVAAPAVDDGVVFIGSSDGTFRALALDDGTTRWTYDGLDGFVETRPAVDDRHVYFGAWDRSFYALDKATGRLAWKWTSDREAVHYSPAAVVPVVAHGKVFVVAPDRYVTALDAASGRVVWRSNRHQGRESVGVSGDGSVVYVKAMQDTLFALAAAPDTLRLAWAVDAGFGYEISPARVVEDGGLVFVPTQYGMLYAVDRAARQVAWAHKLSNAPINDVFPLPGRRLLATTLDGRIVVLAYPDPDAG